MCSSNGVTRKVVATIVAAASLTALLYYHKTRKRGKEKEEDQDSSSVVDKEVPAAGWNDGVRLELTVERPGDLKRRIFKSEQTTLTIEKVDFKLDSREERCTTVEGLIDQIYEETATFARGTPEGETFLAQLVVLKALESPWTLLLQDPSGAASISAPEPPEPEDPRLAAMQSPGLLTLLPAHQVGVTIQLPADHTAEERSVQLSITERPGVSLGSTMFHGSTLLAAHLGGCMGPSVLRGKRVLELGAGTGICGLCAAALGAHVTVTDLGVLVPVLEANIAANAAVLGAAGGSIQVREFCWGSDASPLGPPYDLVIASDVVYPHSEGTSHMALLLQSLQHVCAQHSVVVMQHQGRGSDCERQFFEDCRDLFEVAVVGATDAYLVPPGVARPSAPSKVLGNLGCHCLTGDANDTSAVHEHSQLHCIYEFRLLSPQETQAT